MTPLIECLVGKNEISLIDKNTIHFSVLGVGDKKTEQMCLKNIERLLEFSGERTNILINLNGTSREVPWLESIWKAICEHEKVNVIALISSNSGVRHALSFSDDILGKKTIKYFNTQEEAFDALVSKKQ